jgi:hypothetical protein
MTIEQADDTKTLTEDEQFAQLTAGNPLFDENAPGGTAPADQQQDDAGKTTQDGQAKDAEARVDDANGSGDQQQAQAATGQVAQTQDDAAAAVDDEPFPGYASLAPEAREAVDKVIADRKKYENDYRALHGMTAPLQRGNAELRRQQEALVARIQQLEQLGRKQQDVSAAKDQVTQEFDEWSKQFPEESRALLAMVNPLREKVTALEGSLNAAQAELGNLHVERQQAALAREVGELDKAHPEWRSIHESQDYWDWLNHQPPGIQALNGSMFAGDNIQLLHLFKSSRPRQQQQPNTPAARTESSAAADNVQQRRSQALARGTQPNIRSTESLAAGQGSQGGDMSDEDAQFASLVANNPLFR